MEKLKNQLAGIAALVGVLGLKINWQGLQPWWEFWAQ
jgi:hypothetical protein